MGLLFTVERKGGPMTSAQHARWTSRKKISWLVYGIMVVAIGFLGYSLQAAQNKHDVEQAKANLWRTIVDHMPAAIIVATEHGNIIAWNNGATRLFGWEEDEVVGSSTAFLMPCEELRQKHREFWASAEMKQELYTGTIYTMTTDALHKSGDMLHIRGKVTGSTNAHNCFILLFWAEAADSSTITRNLVTPKRTRPFSYAHFSKREMNNDTERQRTCGHGVHSKRCEEGSAGVAPTRCKTGGRATEVPAEERRSGSAGLSQRRSSDRVEDYGHYRAVSPEPVAPVPWPAAQQHRRRQQQIAEH